MKLEKTRGGDGISILSSMVQEDLSNEVTSEQKPEELSVEEHCRQKEEQVQRP